MHLRRILADHHDRRPGLDERPRREGVLAERGRPDRQDEVVRRERLAEVRPVGGQVAGEERVILRESGPRR